MTILYGLFVLMLVGAIGLFVISSIINNEKIHKPFWIIIFLMILFSSGLYQLTSDAVALKYWLTRGEQHYKLLVEYNRLGGIDGMIDKIKKKLSANPNDKQGWIILSKLYQMKKDSSKNK